MIDLIAGAGLVVGLSTFIWYSSAPDRPSDRSALSKTEQMTARSRIEWVKSTLLELSEAAKLKEAPRFKIANYGAHYQPVFHRVGLSLALLSRLDEQDLRLILAHEIGHAVYRWDHYVRVRSLADEHSADCIALKLTGEAPAAWARAAIAVVHAEDQATFTSELVSRARALGVDLAGAMSQTHP